MSDTIKNIVEKFVWYVSSFHHRSTCSDENIIGVVQKEMLKYDDGSTEVKDVLKLLRDPMRPFWVTLPQFRTHRYKKEFEETSKLEKYMCRDSELEASCARALGYYVGRRPWQMKQLAESPFLYGADVPTEVLVKQKYAKHQPKMIAPFTRGALDIESEVRGEKRINAITFIHEHEVYTCVLKEFCRIHIKDEEFRPATKEDCLKVIDDYLGKYMKDNGFSLTFEIAEDELSLIKWIFAQIHRCKTNFVGIWNIEFDMPKIMERIEKLGASIEEVMCHPDVPVEARMVDWRPDKSNSKQKAHLTDRWHWLTIAGYTQFLDSMLLYARLRKASGKESSYSLDYISNKILGTGKLKLTEGEISNHWYQQTYNFLPYIAYNINDVLILQLMEFKTNDMIGLSALSGKSLASEFAKQSVQVRNNAYDFARDYDRVTATASMNMFTEFDNEMLKVGGTVLPPNKAVGVSEPVVKELLGRATLVTLMTNDLDVSSFFPSVIEAFNISKESYLGSVLHVNGHHPLENEILNGGIVQPMTGAMEVGKKFFGLESYQEMLKAYEEEHKL
jgi:hypothetical protein